MGTFSSIRAPFGGESFYSIGVGPFYVVKATRPHRPHRRGAFLVLSLRQSYLHQNRLVPLYRRSVGKSRTGTYLVSYANRAACRGCGLRERCTKNTYRSITRFENEATMERMANRLAARPEVMDRRRESVEHPFGSIKQWMGQGAFLTRRLGNVRGEFSLTALAYNMRRAINLVGIPALIAVAAV